MPTLYEQFVTTKREMIPTENGKWVRWEDYREDTRKLQVQVEELGSLYTDVGEECNELRALVKTLEDVEEDKRCVRLQKIVDDEREDNNLKGRIAKLEKQVLKTRDTLQHYYDRNAELEKQAKEHSLEWAKLCDEHEEVLDSLTQKIINLTDLADESFDSWHRIEFGSQSRVNPDVKLAYVIGHRNALSSVKGTE